MHPAHGILLDLTADSAIAEAAAPDRAGLVTVISARCLTKPAPAAALLIRPDGHVAWAAGPGTPDPVRPKAQLTLPEEIRRALHIGEGDEVEFAVQEDGTAP
jgi:AbrB family looped-hinge helix DNA binding protein